MPVACSQLARRAVEDALAVGQHDQLVGVAVGLRDVVGRVDDGRALAGEAQDELPQALALARVEAGAGLVEEQHVGFGEQADRDVHALAVAARQRADLIVGALVQVGQHEHPLDGRLGSATRSSRANSMRFSATVSLL